MRAFWIATLTLAASAVSPLFPQSQSFYSGLTVTGQLALVRTVNLRQRALAAQQVPTAASFLQRLQAHSGSSTLLSTGEGAGKIIPFLRPSRTFPGVAPRTAAASRDSAFSASLAPMAAVGMGLSINPVNQSFGFDGITHAQQRLANRGNQFSVEPPSQGLAVGNGYVLEGVNNAVQVYSTSGTPQLATVLSTNEVFGLPPAIDQLTGVNGVFPTDIRTFFD